MKATIRAEDVLRMAGVSTNTLAIRFHQHNYAWVGVRIEDGVVTAAEYRDDIIDAHNERYANPSWHVIGTYGTGSTPCNCDACQAGDDPAVWADDDGDVLWAIEDELQAALNRAMALEMYRQR